VLIRMGEAARTIGICPATLRRWEKLGLVSPPRRLNNRRVYSEIELEEIKQNLLRTCQAKEASER
jgi:DNA-binding transcriptional MerR regulator